MNRYLLIAGLLGATGVTAGAFGAHALQASVSPERIDIWETAAQYHLIHAAVILALALTDITQLAMITPIGGLLLMLSWLVLVFKAFK